jgi:hypothetical protein
MTTSPPSTTATVTSTPLNPGVWLTGAIGATALIVLLNIFVAYRMDVFGVFRDTHGRRLFTAAHERKAKYLLNERYVPQNFDALVVGSSTSINWRTTEFTGYKFYNESLEGGNAVEEKILVDEALKTGHYKVALICLHPHLTSARVLNDGLDAVDKSEALGSELSFRMEFHALRDRFQGPRAPYFFPDGSHDMPERVPKPPNEGEAMVGSVPDDVSVKALRELVQELVSSGTRIVYVVSPLYGANYEINRKVMTDYLTMGKQDFYVAPVIDFNDPEYQSFRYEPKNFIDEVHLSAQGTATLSRLINSRMHQALGD